MKKTISKIMIVAGIIATLWGGMALMLAFNGYTPETSHLGSGEPSDIGFSYTYDEEGNQSPTDEEVSQALAEFDAQRAALVRTHKIRGGMLFGAGVVVLAGGIFLALSVPREKKEAR